MPVTAPAAVLPSVRAQADRLLELGISQLASAAAQPLRTLARSGDGDGGGALLAVHPDLVPTSVLALLLRRGDRPGFVVTDMDDVDLFQPIEGLDVPDAPVYLLDGLDRGDAMSNWSPDEALPSIAARGRTPLLLSEGAYWLLQAPEVLERNRCFMTIGSRRRKPDGRLDARTPAIWISGGTGRDGRARKDAPKVGWCWAGNRHTWLGVASAGVRHTAATGGERGEDAVPPAAPAVGRGAERGRSAGATVSCMPGPDAASARSSGSGPQGSAARERWPAWATRPLAVLAHDPAWGEAGEVERRRLQHLLAPWLTGEVEHVGSTAVPGLAAKPIIDLQAPVRELAVAPAVALRLAPDGWHDVPPELDSRPWRRFLVKVADGRRVAHLHLMLAEHPRWTEQIAFRDALLAAPARAAEYGALKEELARLHGHDREAYTAAKAEFIRSVLDEARGARQGRVPFADDPGDVRPSSKQTQGPSAPRLSAAADRAAPGAPGAAAARLP